MSEPTDTYPDEATLGGTERSTGEGEAALRAALDAHGEELAAAVERTDAAGDLIETALLMVASADEDEVEYVADSAANLIRAADGLSTDGAATLAADLGDNAEDLSEALELVLELQREGHLEELVDLARTLSAIEVDADAVEGLNTVIAAVGEAEREHEPVGFLGLLRGLRAPDARAGLGYLLSLLRAQGRRLRSE
ncbi:MAG: DUF1641 domain-containing protein [Salinirussus sp.]